MTDLKILILNLVAIILNGLLAFVNLLEWYVVAVQKQTTAYPFGAEGPVPYYYQTAELYSTISLLWGILFLAVFIFAIFTLIRSQRKSTYIALFLTIFLAFGQFIHAQIST